MSLTDVSFSLHRVFTLCGEPVLVIPGGGRQPGPGVSEGKRDGLGDTSDSGTLTPLQGTLRPTGILGGGNGGRWAP